MYLTVIYILGADGNVNEYDVFRNTAMSYLCQKYTAYKDTVYEHELRHCIGELILPVTTLQGVI